MKSERYNKIVKCKLCGIRYEDEIYPDSYVLVKDINDLDSDLNIDIKGNLCFNTDFKIKDIEKVVEIKSLEDFYDFCKKNKIEIDKNNIHSKGLIVGGCKDYFIFNDLIPYGWISENYIENDEEKIKILDQIEEENEENFCEEI